MNDLPPVNNVETYVVIFRHNYEWRVYSSENNSQKYKDNIVQLISHKSPSGFNSVNMFSSTVYGTDISIPHGFF
jgi:hypothetical protein